MKPFEQLTQQGKIRRLHRMARDVLSHYPIDVEKITCVSVRYSTIFCVHGTDNQRYMLRINVPNRRTPQQIRSEMQWLDAITQHTDVIVPQPMKTKSDEWLITVETEGIPEARHAVMTSWLDGRIIHNNVKLHHTKLLGQTMAKLHNFAETFIAPADFMTDRHDNIWEWGAPFYLDDEDTLLTSEQKAIIGEVQHRIEELLTKLYANPDALLFIHTDMHFKNVMVHAGQLKVFDFDDTVWGHPIQDIVVPDRWFKSYDNQREIYENAFREGYASVRLFSYSEDDLEVARRFRDLYGLNFMIHYRPAQRSEFIPRACMWFERWLNST